MLFKLIFIILFGLFSVFHVFTMVCYLFADHSKFLQKYYCKLGWHCHSKDYIFDYSDSISSHCTCKWCGYKGMIDSQGNLF